MPKVNGIPTAEEFRSSVGRTRLRKKFRAADVELDAIIATLSTAQGYRAGRTARALEEMRRLRKRCIDWIVINRGKKRWENQQVRSLGMAADARVETLRSSLFAPTRNEIANRLRKVHQGARMDRKKTANGSLGKAMDKKYAVERTTRRHLPGPMLDNGVRRKFQQFKVRNPQSKFDIEDYVQYCLLPDTQDDPGGALLTARTTQLSRQLQAGVKYCNTQERQDYQLIMVGDGVINAADGRLYDTSGMHSNRSGEGWGIFVVDFDFTFYSGPHTVNEFHHSSFLAGEPVFSAGEIAVENGRVLGVTNKTGHYKAGPAELHRSLLLLQDEGGVNMHHVAVSDPFRAPDVWRRGTDVIEAGGDFTDAELRAAPAIAPPVFV
ncbi:MAG: hypothetical protein AAF958_08900 [Planctomycetota bacterium]